MEYLSKVTLNKAARRNYMIKISLVGSVSLVGLVLAIINIFTGRFLSVAWSLAGTALGLSYVIIKINTAFPTYLATDGEKVVLSVWKNGVMPYTLPETPTLISDFIPEKVNTVEVLVEDIKAVIIGSKRLLKKHLDEDEYPQILTRLSEDKHFDKILKRMDFIYIRTKTDENCFMPITDFDTADIAEFVGIVERYCNGVQIVTNIPKLVRMRNN